MKSVNQIHDVGKLVREAVKAGWDFEADGMWLRFSRAKGSRIARLNIYTIVRNRETLAQHRRALGLDDHKTSEAAT